MVYIRLYIQKYHSHIINVLFRSIIPSSTEQISMISMEQKPLVTLTLVDLVTWIQVLDLANSAGKGWDQNRRWEKIAKAIWVYVLYTYMHTFHSIPLHCITLHYITLHYITYIHNYITLHTCIHTYIVTYIYMCIYTLSVYIYITRL